MNNFEQKMGNSAAPMAPKRVHRGIKTSRAEFIRLWNNPALTTEEIGRYLNITQTQVCRRAQARGLPPRGKLVFCRIRDEALFSEMWREKVLVADIARHFDVSVSAVKRTCNRLGLQARKRGKFADKITLDQFWQERLARRMAATAVHEQVLMLDVGMIDRTNQVQTFMRIRREAGLS